MGPIYLLTGSGEAGAAAPVSRFHLPLPCSIAQSHSPTPHSDSSRGSARTLK